MKSALLICFAGAVLTVAAAQQPFPAHWGEPPRIQTRDLIDLPGGYGKGSSTMRNWINANLEKDKLAQAGGSKNAAPPQRPFTHRTSTKRSWTRFPKECWCWTAASP